MPELENRDSTSVAHKSNSRLSSPAWSIHSSRSKTQVHKANNNLLASFRSGIRSKSPIKSSCGGVLDCQLWVATRDLAAKDLSASKYSNRWPRSPLNLSICRATERFCDSTSWTHLSFSPKCCVTYSFTRSLITDIRPDPSTTSTLSERYPSMLYRQTLLRCHLKHSSPSSPITGLVL